MINSADVSNLFMLNRRTIRSDIAYPEEKYEHEVSQMLKGRGIRNKVDNEGMLRYNHRDQKVIDEVYSAVMAKYTPDWPSAWFSVDSIRQEVIKYLELRQIPYKIRKVGEENKEFIFWPHKYDSDVNAYYEHLLNEYSKN